MNASIFFRIFSKDAPDSTGDFWLSPRLSYLMPSTDAVSRQLHRRGPGWPALRLDPNRPGATSSPPHPTFPDVSQTKEKAAVVRATLRHLAVPHVCSMPCPSWCKALCCTTSDISIDVLSSCHRRICVALLLVLFFFNTYAANTSYGRPARLDCWDGIEMINNTKFTIWGDPKWVPIRCPAYCKYRGGRNATVIGAWQIVLCIIAWLLWLVVARVIDDADHLPRGSLYPYCL